MLEYIDKQDRIELNFILGAFKSASQLFQPNFSLYYGRSVKSGPKI